MLHRLPRGRNTSSPCQVPDSDGCARDEEGSPPVCGAPRQPTLEEP